VLNVRLYRIAWLLAIVGILLVLLNLKSPAAVPPPAVPPAISAAAIVNATNTVQSLAPTRAPGSAGDEAVAGWVQQQFIASSGAQGSVTGGAARVGQQTFVARWRGRLIHGTNVYLSLPGTLTGAAGQSAIVIAAPRDAPPGVTADASATGMLVALAQLSANTAHQRPLIFVSTDASTVGNAGMRWFLPKVHGVRIGAVISVDAPDESPPAGSVWVWAGGRDNRQALGLDQIARTAIARAGGAAAPAPGVVTQLLRLAVPQTFGDQAPAIAEGIPAVTVAGRPDTPVYGPALAGETQLAVFGNAVLGLVGSLDVMTGIPGPTAAVFVVGRQLDAVALMVILFLGIMPVLAVAADASLRLRRARIPWRPGIVSLGWRLLPWVVAVCVGTALARAGLMPGMSAGQVPQPADAPILARSLVALAAIVVVGLVLSAWGASHIARLVLIPASDVAASLVGLGLMLVVAFVLRPFMIVLVLVAAHAAVLALTASRRWQLVLATVVGLVPVAALCWSVSDQLHRGIPYAAWYLLVTTIQGGRGVFGPMVAVILVVCAGSVVTVADRRLRNVPQIPRPAVWDVVTARARGVWADR
jgi:hypothetical protein